MTKITLCDIIGHKWNFDEDGHVYGCARCQAAGRQDMTYLELADAYGDMPWWGWLLPTHAYLGLKGTALALVCRVRGHDLVDYSYGGPDRGCVSVECKRCGHHYEETLY